MSSKLRMPLLILAMLFTSTQCDKATQSPSSNTRIVTLAEYNQIEIMGHIGRMTLQDIQAIIGSEGEEASRYETPGSDLRFTGRWTNPDGSYVICTFFGRPDGRLNGVIAKEQSGL